VDKCFDLSKEMKEKHKKNPNQKFWSQKRCYCTVHAFRASHKSPNQNEQMDCLARTHQRDVSLQMSVDGPWRTGAFPLLCRLNFE
jgi:hypothetical protein